MKYVVTCAFALLTLGVTACGGSARGQAPSDNEAVQAAASTNLTCKSYGFCTSYSVARYHGVALPAATGGKLVDGLYRLAYTIEPTGEGLTPREDRAEGILIRGSQFLFIGPGQSSYGSFETTSGSDAKLFFNPTAYCDSERADDLTGAPEAIPWGRRYVVDADGQLVIFEDESLAYVYLPASKLCGPPSEIPEAPGADSASCVAGTCGCTEASEAAPDQKACDLITGS